MINLLRVRVCHNSRPDPQKSPDDCESWFADCHEEAYEHFEQVMARR